MIDIRSGERVTVDLCDGAPIGGGSCERQPVATVEVGPLLSCQRVVPMEAGADTASLRLCTDHVTPFVDMTCAWLCCDTVPLTLRWDR